MNYGSLRAEFNVTSNGDAWGHTMHWWFSIADEIYFNRPNLSIPDKWQFKPSLFGEANDSDDYVTTCVREATDQDLETFGTLMHRYAQYLKHIGVSY